MSGRRSERWRRRRLRRDVRGGKFSLDDFFVSLDKLSLRFNSKTPGVVKQLIHTLVCDFSIQKFADARLRFSEDHLQFFLGIFLRELQDCLV